MSDTEFVAWEMVVILLMAASVLVGFVGWLVDPLGPTGGWLWVSAGAMGFAALVGAGLMFVTVLDL